jgi:hypothetical protein
MLFNRRLFIHCNKKALLQCDSMTLSRDKAVSQSDTSNLPCDKRSVAMKLRTRWGAGPRPHLLTRFLHGVIILAKQTCDAIKKFHLQKLYEITVSWNVRVGCVVW